MGKFIKLTGYIFLAAGAGVVLLNQIGVYMEHGWSGLQELLSQRNMWNFATTVVLLAPGLALVALGDKLIARRTRRRSRGP
jgi:hypothetical protein